MKKNFIVFLHAHMSLSFEQIWGRPISFCFRLSHLFPTLLCLLPKTSENLPVFYCFQGVKKSALGTNGLSLKGSLWIFNYFSYSLWQDWRKSTDQILVCIWLQFIYCWITYLLLRDRLLLPSTLEISKSKLDS